jgi:predicted trehalose synthase
LRHFYEIDINAVLITAWLDYVAGYYCCMAEETEGAKTKKARAEHEKYDNYASRAVDAYLTAKSALLFYVDEDEETE